MSGRISPRELLTGWKLDYNKHCRLAYGDYVQVHEKTTNTTKSRATGAIALRPTGNAQGGYYFFSLTTGRRLNRNAWTELPMPSEVIQRVHDLAKNAPAGLQFGDRNNNPDPDDDEDFRPDDLDEDDEDHQLDDSIAGVDDDEVDDLINEMMAPPLRGPTAAELDSDSEDEDDDDDDDGDDDDPDYTPSASRPDPRTPSHGSDPLEDPDDEERAQAAADAVGSDLPSSPAPQGNRELQALRDNWGELTILPRRTRQQPQPDVSNMANAKAAKARTNAKAVKARAKLTPDRNKVAPAPSGDVEFQHS